MSDNDRQDNSQISMDWDKLILIKCITGHKQGKIYKLPILTLIVIAVKPQKPLGTRIPY